MCKDNIQERSIILVSMNMAAQSSIAWIALLVWKTKEAPRFFKGYVWASVSSLTMMGFTVIIFVLLKRESRQNEKKILYSTDSHGSSRCSYTIGT